MKNKKKVLITGGSGFIGHHLKNILLRNNFNILTIGRNKNENITVDLNDLKLKTILSDFKPEIIFHLASGSNIKLAQENKEKEIKDTVNGTDNFIKSIVDSKVKIEKFIYLSSQAVYGEINYLPVDEIHDLNPISTYGECKLQAEKLIVNSNLNYLIFRVSSVYGEGQKKSGVISAFINLLKNNQPPVVFNDENSFIDLIYVKDLVKALSLICEKEIGKNIFNLSSGKKTTLKTILNELYKFFPQAPKYEIKQSPLYKQSLFNGVILENKKLVEYLGWTPHFNLEEGLKEIYLGLKNEICH